MALKEEQGLGNWEIATAKKLVSEYRRKHRILEREEFEDLMQECLAHWIVARRRIPPGPDPDPDPRPPVSYMAQVLRNKLTDMVREMTADKRAGDPGALSLDAPLDGTEDGITLGDILADEQADLGRQGLRLGGQARAIGVVPFAAVLRAAIEGGTLLAAALRTARAIAARRGLEVLALAALCPGLLYG